MPPLSCAAPHGRRLQPLTCVAKEYTVCISLQRHDFMHATRNEVIQRFVNKLWDLSASTPEHAVAAHEEQLHELAARAGPCGNAPVHALC